MEELEQYTHAQLTRWRLLAQGQREGMEDYDKGKKQRDCPYGQGTPLKKGWRKGWRRRDRESKEVKYRQEHGWWMPNGSFYIPPTSIPEKAPKKSKKDTPSYAPTYELQPGERRSRLFNAAVEVGEVDQDRQANFARAHGAG